MGRVKRQKAAKRALLLYKVNFNIDSPFNILSKKREFSWIFKIFQISFVVFEAGPDFLKSCARYNIDLRKALPKLFQGLTYASKKIC